MEEEEIDLEASVQFGVEVGTKAADIIVYTDNSKETPKIIVECKKPKRKDGIEQLKSYMNAKGAPVALVGKGITFDSGGLNLKPGGSMEEMKCDMAGAATVLGAVNAAARLKLPVRVSALAPLAENLATMQETPFARYPVYRGSDSDVAGTLEAKTLLDELGKDVPELFRDIRPALFVSESTHALKLVEILREEQQSMALVVDEYGDIQGLVTISDVMSVVLGRLQAAADARSGSGGSPG